MGYYPFLKRISGVIEEKFSILDIIYPRGLKIILRAGGRNKTKKMINFKITDKWYQAITL